MPVFADGMTVRQKIAKKKKKKENRKELTKSQNKKKTYQLLELISNYNKVAGQINVEKSIPFYVPAMDK